MLRTLHGKARREHAIKWLTDAQQKCGYGQMIWVQNTMHRYLAGAINRRIELLSWTLQAPSALKTQAIKKKREI